MPGASTPRDALAAVVARPRAMAVAGALTIAWSSILVRLAEVEPSTAAIFRCAYAVPVLWLLTRLEDRRHGPRPARSRWLAIAAGALFAADLITWHHSIANVGAGLATVFGNLQVLLVPLLAWIVLRERPERRALLALPAVLAGVLMLSGALEDGAYGEDPRAGALFGLATALTYAGFILVLRASGADLRRPAGPLFDATLSAAVVSVAAGLALGEADLAPSWPAHGWLLVLALSSQVAGWLLIGTSLPRLPAGVTSVLLTIQPVGSVALGALLFAEAPSALQLLGVAVVLGCIVGVSRGPRDAPVVREPAPEAP